MDPSLQDRADKAFHEQSLYRASGILVAISGGSDSLALLLLLKTWRDRHWPVLHLAAATVDHGLRAGSAAEAAWVAGVCARLEIEHRIVRWTGPKPATGIAAAARLARYGLLAGVATDLRCGVIVTGHTLDDQAETVAMRETRGGRLGLAGMAPFTRYDGRLWIVRPMLNMRRAELRGLLTAAGECWIDDPSNENVAAERVRVRRRLHANEAEIMRLVSKAAAAAALRADLARRAAVVLQSATMPSPGLVRLPAAFLDTTPADAAIHALRILLATVGGTEHLPDEERVTALFASMRAAPGTATLARAVVDRRRDAVFLHRERRTLPGPEPVVSPTVWDRRFVISTGPRGATVEPAGLHRAREALGNELDVPGGLAAAALAAEPIVMPTDASARVVRRIAPFALFLPGFDIPACNAVADVIGAARQPASPADEPGGAAGETMPRSPDARSNAFDRSLT